MNGNLAHSKLQLIHAMLIELEARLLERRNDNEADSWPFTCWLFDTSFWIVSYWFAIVCGEKYLVIGYRKIFVDVATMTTSFVVLMSYRIEIIEDSSPFPRATYVIAVGFLIADELIDVRNRTCSTNPRNSSGLS